MATFPALFGLHFHACRLFHTCQDVSSGWAPLFDSRETTEILSSIHSVRDAAEALGGETDHMKHRAAAILARGLRDAQRPAAGSAPPDGLDPRAFEDGIRALVPDEADALLRGIAKHGGDRALSFVFGTLEGDPSFHYEVKANEITQGVSRFSVEVTRAAKGKTLDDFVRLTDPRRWVVNARESFDASYPTAPQAAQATPLDPLGPDPPKDESRAATGAGYVGNLFEKYKFPLFGSVDLTEYRNLLNIDFTVEKRLPARRSGAARWRGAPGSRVPQIQLEYSLYRSLTSKVLFVQHQGGIDVDSGKGSVLLDSERDQVTFVAGKNIRFSPAAPFHTELNVLALPFLWYWITGLTLLEL